jgi:hypothetical protein
MSRIAYILGAVAALGGVLVYIAQASGETGRQTAPIFGIKIPPGYRDWSVISVTHEAGNNNDLRAVLGNDVAIKAYREQKLPFPDGTGPWRLGPNADSTSSSRYINHSRNIE